MYLTMDLSLTCSLADGCSKIPSFLCLVFLIGKWVVTLTFFEKHFELH